MAPHATAALASLLAHLGPLSTLFLLLLAAPIATACVVLIWHGVRGTDPGPAGVLLLQLIRLILLMGREPVRPAGRRASRRR